MKPGMAGAPEPIEAGVSIADVAWAGEQGIPRENLFRVFVGEVKVFHMGWGWIDLWTPSIAKVQFALNPDPVRSGRFRAARVQICKETIAASSSCSDEVSSADHTLVRERSARGQVSGDWGQSVTETRCLRARGEVWL